MSGHDGGTNERVANSEEEGCADGAWPEEGGGRIVGAGWGSCFCTADGEGERESVWKRGDQVSCTLPCCALLTFLPPSATVPRRHARPTPTVCRGPWLRSNPFPTTTSSHPQYPSFHRCSSSLCCPVRTLPKIVLHSFVDWRGLDKQHGHPLPPLGRAIPTFWRRCISLLRSSRTHT